MYIFSKIDVENLAGLEVGGCFLTINLICSTRCLKVVCNKHLHIKKEGVESSVRKKKCIRQLALNAEKNAKFHSNLIQAGQFTAENAWLRNDQQGQDDIKLTA